MGIDHKALALLTAAILGSGLIACQRAGEEQTARNQDSSTPMNQAPKQGYTGPATSAPAAGATSEEKSGQPADETGSPNSNQMKQPGNTEQQQPQR
ncbi:MAG: hypothetical protein PHY45_07945 [Rhodocyclaceae bacterium]|nr:hypothetical protein [Rhodocyclaceae bacterium]